MDGQYPWGLADIHYDVAKRIVEQERVALEDVHRADDLEFEGAVLSLVQLGLADVTFASGKTWYTPNAGTKQMCGMPGVPKALWPHFRRHDHVQDLANGIPFTWSRWGDTEVYTLFGRHGKNSDGHAFMPGYSDALRKIFEDGQQPNYRLGQGSMACCAGGALYENLLRETDMLSANWSDVDEFPYQQIQACREGKVAPLLMALRERKHFRSLCVVGHSMLEGLSNPEYCNLQIDAFISTFPKNCSSQTEQKIAECRDVMAKLPRPIVLMASCSFMANLIVHALYPEYGEDCWLLDVGSIWEPYPGVWGMRRYKRKYFRHIVEHIKV